MSKQFYWIIAVALFLFSIFSFSYKLRESPPTWIDEGIITQVAQNVAHSSTYAVQIAPDKFVSAGFVTTGPSVILPIALSLKLFGNSLLSARPPHAFVCFTFTNFCLLSCKITLVGM